MQTDKLQKSVSKLKLLMNKPELAQFMELVDVSNSLKEISTTITEIKDGMEKKEVEDSKQENKIEEVKIVNPANELGMAIWGLLKGEKGEKGEPGEKGETVYPNAKEIKKVVKPLLAKIVKDLDIKDGYTPIKGVDYFDGKDGESPKIEDIVPVVLNKIPNEVTLIKAVVEALKKIEDAWLDIKNISGIDILTNNINKEINAVKSFIPRNLNSLYDVQVKTEPTQGQTLTWDAGLKKWIPGTAVGSNAGLTLLTATGTVDGNNTAFTFTQQPTYIVADGAWYKINAGWTWSGSTVTMSVPPQVNIWGFV